MARGQHVRLWWAELLALFANILALIALIIVLIVYDDKPIFDWYSITLNTVVSVISTAAKAPIMYAIAEGISQWKWIVFSRQGGHDLMDFKRMDSASRGPWGSIDLLWHSRSEFVFLILIKLGAILIIFAIAMDPFSQQLVQFKPHFDETDSSDVEIARGQRYSKGIEFIVNNEDHYSHGEHFDGTRTDADYAMQGAIFYGLIHDLDQIQQQVRVKCPSGDCTWSEYESLAVCYTCNDLSEKLTNTTEEETWAKFKGSSGSSATGIANVTTFSLPNGLWIDSFDGQPLSGDIWMASSATGEASETIALKELDTLISSMAFIRAKNNTGQNWPDCTLEALECGLYYCVNRYNSVVREGVLSESHEHVTTPTRNPESWRPRSDAEARKLDKYNSLTSLEFDVQFSSIPRSDLMLGDGFNVSQAAVDSISFFFQTNFNENRVAKYDSGSTTLSKPPHSMYAWSSKEYEPSSMQRFMIVDDLRKPFESIAQSMSNTLRADSDGPAIHTGNHGVNRIYYRIVWPWITLHIVVILAGSGFLLVTVAESHGKGVPVWTSSALAVLAIGYVAKDVLKRVDTKEDLEKQANGQTVRLLGGDVGFEEESTSVLVGAEQPVVSSRVSLMEDVMLDDLEQRN